jgi:hypothetical protein
MSDQTQTTERALMRHMLEMSMVIESASDDALDPDLAVQWLEDIGYVAQRLPLDARLRLADVAKELAEEARANGRTEVATFFDSAPDDLGIFEVDAEPDSAG